MGGRANGRGARAADGVRARGVHAAALWHARAHRELVSGGAQAHAVLTEPAHKNECVLQSLSSSDCMRRYHVPQASCMYVIAMLMVAAGCTPRRW